VADARIDGYDTVVIESPSCELQATFVPAAGMVCCSLRHRRVELLAQRAGVEAYAQRGSTMGIPLLYPWANRLAGLRYPGPDGEKVRLDPADPLLKFDQNDLPIHGAIAGGLPWELDERPRGGAAAVRARLDWRSSELLAIFPFPHTVHVEARIEGETTLAIETSVHADGPAQTGGPARTTGSRAPGAAPAPEVVPVSFGYHPYLTLPRSDRAGWTVELPVSRRLALDEHMIPTGGSEPLERRRFRLAAGSWDDAYDGLLDPPVFRLSAGDDDVGLRISLELRRGYTHAQLYAPASERFVCFEPMTAPTNALLSRRDLRLLAPGESFSAEYAISVQAGAAASPE
jgi:galactose mutarotase-like enzyme